MPLESKELVFPFKGINEVDSFNRKSENTTRDALNVMPFDIDGQLRGGQRPGLSRYIGTQVNSSNQLQLLTSVTEAFDPSAIIADQELFDVDFTTASSTGRIVTLDPTNWTEVEGTTGNIFAGATPGSSGRQMEIADDVDGTRVGRSGSSVASSNNHGELVLNITVGDNYIIETFVKIRVSITSATKSAVIQWRAEPTSTGQFNCQLIKSGATTGEYIAQIVRTGGTVVATSSVFTLTANSGGVYTDPINFKVNVTGNIVSVEVDGLTRISATDTGTTHNANTRVGIGTVGISGNKPCGFTRVRVFTGIQPASLRTTTLVTVAGGTIKTGTQVTGLSTPASGSSAVGSSGIVRAQEAFQDVFFVNGTAADYKYLDLATDEVKDWATDITGGSLPVGTTDTTKACRIITLYFGAIVMSALQEDPQNWFMTAINNPFDLNYGSTDRLGAVAGNNSKAGLIGDVITSLMVNGDDLLFFGGSHTVWVLSGHPRNNGRIDNVSRQIGVVGADAFTWDDDTLYFLGPNGMYSLPSTGGNLTNISRNRYDKTFSNINFATNNIRLVFDKDLQGVWIFVTPQSEPSASTDQYYWDKRTDSFWRVQLPPNEGPSASFYFEADSASDRALLVGSNDGYINKVDTAATNDISTAINSYVDLPLLQMNGSRGLVKLNEIQAILDRGSGGSTKIELYKGETAEIAAEAVTPSWSRSSMLTAQRNVYNPRMSDNAFRLRLQNSAASQGWSFETGEILFENLGVSRK